eukprot:513917_1
MLGIMLRCLVMLLILQCGDARYCIYACYKENVHCWAWQQGYYWKSHYSCREEGASPFGGDHTNPACKRRTAKFKKLDQLPRCRDVERCELDENVCNGFVSSLDTNNDYSEKAIQIITSVGVQGAQGLVSAVNPGIGVGIGIASTLTQFFDINPTNILQRVERIINDGNRKLKQCIDRNMATNLQYIVEAKLAALKSDIQRVKSWDGHKKEEERALYDVIVSCDRFMAEINSLSSNSNGKYLLLLLPIIKTWGQLCSPYFAIQIKLEPNETKKQIHYALWKQTYQNAKDFVRNAKQKIENYYWYQCEHSARYRYDQKMKYLQQEFYDPINKWRDTIPHSLPIQSKKQIHDEIHEIHDEL